MKTLLVLILASCGSTVVTVPDKSGSPFRGKFTVYVDLTSFTGDCLRYVPEKFQTEVDFDDRGFLKVTDPVKCRTSFYEEKLFVDCSSPFGWATAAGERIAETQVKGKAFGEAFGCQDAEADFRMFKP